MRTMNLLLLLYGITFSLEDCSSGLNDTDCEQICVDNCHTCSDKNTCTHCVSGYFLHIGTCQKCKSNCLNCSTWYKCAACEDGFYNGYLYDDNNNYDELYDCSLSCHKNCKSCTSFHNCNVCKHPHLRNCKTCFPQNNTCSTCKKENYGYYCQNKCQIGCKNHECDMRTGTCNCSSHFQGQKCSYCEDGYHGKHCEISCPYGCDTKRCSQDGKCDRCKERFTGSKCELCKEGFYGENCQKQCSKHCKSCFTMDNYCLSCTIGKYGKKEAVNGQVFISCHINCSDYCKDKTCKFDTGECEHGCVHGYWGERCNNQCLRRCTNGICFRNNGTCNLGILCNRDRFGPNCDQPCRSNCLADDKGRQCNVSNGYCIGRCSTGYFGNFCDRNCSENCKNTTCNKNGNCIFGCIDGFTGDSCDLPEIGPVIVLKVIGYVVAVVAVVVVIAAVSIAFFLFRRRCNKTTNKRNEQNDDNDVTAAANIDQESSNTFAQNKLSSHSGLDNASVIGMLEKPKRNSKPDRYSYQVIAETNVGASADTNATVQNQHDPTQDDDPGRTNAREKSVRKSLNVVISKPSNDDYMLRKPSAGKFARHKSYNEGVDNIETFGSLKRLSKKTKSVGDIHRIELVQAKIELVDVDETYYNVIAVRMRKITLDKLSDFVAKKMTQFFVNEFQLLPRGLIKPYLHSQKKENACKNRYRGLFPYDATRVVLKEGDSDYINASYIDGYNKCKAYIASTGPAKQFMGDMSAFWVMLWQEKVGKIVMLTNLIEGGTAKCDQYWPEKDLTRTFANILVTCKSEDIFSFYTKRSFIVQRDKESRHVVHFHFTAWPDKRTPDDVTSLVEFRQKVNSTYTSLTGPVIVHCSAGIGRTGTYIALDSITKEGEAEGGVDVYAFVRNMREQRVNMVQTAEQYQYLHNALVYTLTFDSKAIDVSKFCEYMKTYNEDDIGRMFVKLQASVEKLSENEYKAVERNKTIVQKNRGGADIPGDMFRPRLFLNKTSQSLDYINAVYVNSYRYVDRYLVAQTPLPETVDDFLTLIVQESVCCIVAMETDQYDDKIIGVYSPLESQTLKIGTFKVTSKHSSETEYYRSKKITITNKGKIGTHNMSIPEFQFKQWHKHQVVPDQVKTFVQFVNEVDKNFGAFNGPILVHCKTGAEKSGLFCAVSTLLEKARFDKEVSVANTVRQIKHRRHLAIPSEEQYVFCHQIVKEYLQTSDVHKDIL